VENEKLVEYVKLVREENDQEAFQNIVKVLHTYLMHLSNRFFRIPGNGSEDVYQEGLFALSTKAIPDYKEEKGAFVSFAKLCIKRHIITVLKAANNGRNRILNGSVSLECTACNDDSEGPMSISEFYQNKHKKQESVLDSLARSEANSKLKSALTGKLTFLESKVLDCYLQNMSYVDIVSMMNNKKRKNKVDTKVIDNALCRIKKKALEIARDMMFGSENKNPDWD
jgi:RNA polymerase sporulation-specific sigma factor